LLSQPLLGAGVSSLAARRPLLSVGRDTVVRLDSGQADSCKDRERIGGFGITIRGG
jgi:hypothetical protein